MRALETKEEEYEEWKNRIEDIEHENEKLKHKKIKIERQLDETLEISQRIKMREANPQSKVDVALPNGKKVGYSADQLSLVFCRIELGTI
jgi:chromosome segregation ATPase